MKRIYFVRNHGEYRYITVWDDNKYVIHGKSGGMFGKFHDNPTLYVSKMLENGWRKVLWREYFAYEKGKEKEWSWFYGKEKTNETHGQP